MSWSTRSLKHPIRFTLGGNQFELAAASPTEGLVEQTTLVVTSIADPVVTSLFRRP